MRTPVLAAALLGVSVGSGCGTQRIRTHGQTDAPAQAVAVVGCPPSTTYAQR